MLESEVKVEWNNCLMKFSTLEMVAEFFATYLDKTFAPCQKSAEHHKTLKLKSRILCQIHVWCTST